VCLNFQNFPNFSNNLIHFSYISLINPSQRFIFAILGVNLYQSRFAFCENPDSFSISQQSCETHSKLWVTNDLNFENIWNALLTLFVIATFDNWISLLHIARNSDISTNGPSSKNNAYSSYVYFFAFILISVLFLINLFLGIMFVKFQLAEKAGGKGRTHLNENQEKWAQMQCKILEIEPFRNNFFMLKGLRKKVINLVTSNYYSLFMSMPPLVVVIMLMIQDHNSLKKQVVIVENENKVVFLVLSLIFLWEILLKIYAFTWNGYFSYKWNIMEFIIGITYGASTIVDYGFEGFLLNLGVYAKIFKLLRILAIFRLFHRFKFLKKMQQTITFKFPVILHILFFNMLFIMFYAFLGVYFFHDVDLNRSRALDSMLNFKNVFRATATLFVCATGENWSLTLMDTIKYVPKCGRHDYLCGPCNIFSKFSFNIFINFRYFFLYFIIFFYFFLFYH